MKIIGPILTLLLAGCASAQTNIEPLIASSKLVVKHLYRGDTVALVRMFDEPRLLNNRRSEFQRDCKLVQEVVSKFGFPTDEAFKFRVASNGEQVVDIELLPRPDPENNLKSVLLSVSNYPKALVQRNDRILDFGIFIEKSKEEPTKIILPPPSN